MGLTKQGLLPSPHPIKRSKYNINRSLSERTYKNVTYDSVLEMRYFAEIIEPMIELGYIESYERQKKYLLMEGFERKGQKVRPIEYVADFYIKYSNGLEEVIDIKGLPTETAKLKRKLFWNRYPDIDYRWLAYSKKHGGWLDYEDLQRVRRYEKNEKKRREIANKLQSLIEQKENNNG